VTPDDLLAEAREATGLDDLGPGDLHEGLGIYCRSLAEEAQLNDVGRLAIRSAIVSNLVNRLRVVDWAARHPEVADEKIDTFSDADHVRYVAEHWTDVLATSIERIDAFRAAHPEIPILDVHHDDLVREPVATVARIYDSAGAALSAPARAALTAYVEGHDNHRFGVHRYDLAEFGLDAGTVADRFADYVRRYDIPT